MTTWQDYQRQAADFFRNLGMTASTDEHVVGVRGEHDVDVVARKVFAGISQLWVIECKQWKRPVNQLHVSALADIVADVGADRGILLSESGFQPGAIRMARLSNITLSSIPDLREHSEDERAELGLGELRQRITGLRNRITALQGQTYYEEGVIYADYGHVDGVSERDVWNLASKASFAKTAVTDAFEGRWPVWITEKSLWNSRELALRLEEYLVQLDGEITEQEANARSARKAKAARRG
jgi:restriction system protein